MLDRNTPKLTKTEQIAAGVAKAVGAGRAAAVETVDFSDPNRPKTCIEIDFPIVPINQIATIEGKGSGALKPVYQMSKWWARRRSSVFRSLLLASATKAPEDPALAAKAVWDVYYANHQKRGALAHLKVADIFMGGGTTLVEGSRLGMHMYGNDLNPVAWFVTKNEFAKLTAGDVQALFDDIEADVRPILAPFYACDGPNGEKGTWTRLSDSCVMGEDFDPLRLRPEERKLYHYEGPEIIYTFWAKHGPCSVTGCGHQTPIMTSPVIAMKTVSSKVWGDRACPKCKGHFDLEPEAIRMAPDVPLVVADSEEPFAVVQTDGWTTCPHCSHPHQRSALGKPSKKKKVSLTLLVHPDWLKGSPRTTPKGVPYGGAAQDNAASTASWNIERANHIRLIEVRGQLPEKVTCPETGLTFWTDKKGGNVPARSSFQCARCGTKQDVQQSVKQSGKCAPWGGYAFQGASPEVTEAGGSSGNRYFSPFAERQAEIFNAAALEWEERSQGDLKDYWPKEAIPIGAEIGPHDVEGHHFSHWWMMFNPRQLLSLTLLLKSILTVGTHSPIVREFMLGAFQQYLRNQNMFCFWNTQRALEPLFSDNHFHPKINAIENSVFSGLARGDFKACVRKIIDAVRWSSAPWEIAVVGDATHGVKVDTADAIQQQNVEINCCSASNLPLATGSIDLVITDPPFGNNIQYAELADFFLVWLAPSLRSHYPEIFSGSESPKALEAVVNSSREPSDPDSFYKRMLTECWREAHRVLKVAGIMAFTFHHSEDEPWIAVLEALFDAGFYLEATYPIRSDEMKGDGQFG